MIRQKRELTPLLHRGLEILSAAGQTGMDCFSFGQQVWPARSSPISSRRGGGDYAAQMLLGRLRKLGLTQVNLGGGSSRWVLTTKGQQALDAKTVLP